MPEQTFCEAAGPLFDRQLVEVVEWSFDVGWGKVLPQWLTSLLGKFSEQGDLLGHGVSYSPLDASRSPRQNIWLQNLRAELGKRSYHHISEHFGFTGGGNFHLGTPLPVPLTDEAVAVGQRRLRDLAAVSQLPVGLENLGFAFSVQDVANQGRFLERLLAPVEGFLLLDLHNLYCQLCNFRVDAAKLLASYPLERVREIHVSGGSWSDGPQGQPIRRDTHDDTVPEAVFKLVAETVPQCPNLEFVILEQLGDTLHPENLQQFRDDFQRLRDVVGEAT